MRLEELKSALGAQYQAIQDQFEQVDGTIKKSQQYTIEADAISGIFQSVVVDVSIESTSQRHSQNEAMEKMSEDPGFAFCGFAKDPEKAEITIRPANEKIQQVVKEYFSETVFSFDRGRTPKFDSVVINGDQCIDQYTYQ